MHGVSKERLLYANHNFHVLTVWSADERDVSQHFYHVSCSLCLTTWRVAKGPFHLEDYEAIMVNSSTCLGWHCWSFHLFLEVLKHSLWFSCSLLRDLMFSESREEELLVGVVQQKSLMQGGEGPAECFHSHPQGWGCPYRSGAQFWLHRGCLDPCFCCFHPNKCTLRMKCNVPLGFIPLIPEQDSIH